MKIVSKLNMLCIAYYLLGLGELVKAQPLPTNEWVNYFSTNSTFDGLAVTVGTVIDAYDPDSIWCGTFTVTTEGQYGFLAVYRDDVTTTDVDEGAEPGDTITFHINGHLALPMGPGDPIWTANGDVIQLNLEGLSNYPPIISDIPDQSIQEGNLFSSIYLDSYLSDMDNSKNEITWTYNGNKELTVIIDTNRVAIINIPYITWNGSETITFIATDPNNLSDSDKSTFTVEDSIVPPPTNEWVNYFSTNSTFDGLAVTVGTVIDAYDPDSIWCGTFTVTTEGQYGFLAVYRDDPYTSEIDEGAEPGDTITFHINGHLALPMGPGDPIWTANGDVIELNLEAYSNYAPVITGFPDSLIFRADSAITLNLNSYVEDLDDPDSSLHWTISGNDSVIFNLDNVLKIVTLSAPIHWSGIEPLVFTVMDDSSAWDRDTIIVQVMGIVGIKNDFVRSIPKDFCLSQNYPNPFNPQTTIKYGIPEQNYVCIRIYDLLGREITTIVNEEQEAKYYKIIWDGKDQFGNKVSTGMYFYQIVARSKEKIFTKTKKLLLLQ